MWVFYFFGEVWQHLYFQILKVQGVSLITGNLSTVKILQRGFAYVFSVLKKAVFGSWNILEWINSRQFAWGYSGFGY